MPVTTTPIVSVGGNYWTRSGIESIVGDLNLVIIANLDNESTTEDAGTTARIIEDGTAADDYTDFRARRGSRGQYTEAGDTPIPSTDADFALIRRATNLYAAALLVEHRIWTKGDGTTDNQAVVDLSARAEDLYVQLFGKLENNNPDEAKPGTFVNVTMSFDPENTVDENGRWY